jgi:beta-galactosidase GanA
MGQINRYDRKDNPLMIVEIGNEKLFARFFFPVLGRHGLGFAPFGFDFTGYSNYPLGAKKVDAAAIEPFAQTFRILSPMAREWAKISFEKNVWGTAEGDDRKPQQLDLGRWTATVSYGQWQFSEMHNAFKGEGSPPGTENPSGGALIAELGPNEYLVIGQRARVAFALTDKTSGQQPMFVRVEEGHYQDGKWVFDRVWNGDQTDYGLNFTTLPQVLRVTLATF